MPIFHAVEPRNGMPMKSYTKDNAVVTHPYGCRFISYNRIVADYNPSRNELTLYDDLWDFSNTTRKYFKRFINEFTDYSYLDKQQFLKIIKLENPNLFTKEAL